MGINLVKAACATTIMALMAVNTYAINFPRYCVENTHITYPWLNQRDTYHILLLPVIMGPTVNTFLPMNLYVSSSRVYWSNLTTRIGEISLKPRIALSTVFPFKLLRVSDDAKIASYGIEAKFADVTLSQCIATFRHGDTVVIFVGSEYLMIVRGKKITYKNVFGCSYVSFKRGKVILISPEDVFGGAFTWKPELPLSYLL
ncbi:hypothetical protein [Methanopyrus kandleri]